MTKLILVSIFLLVFGFVEEARALTADESLGRSTERAVPSARVPASAGNELYTGVLFAGSGAAVRHDTHCTRDRALGRDVCLTRFVDRMNGVVCYSNDEGKTLQCLKLAN